MLEGASKSGFWSDADDDALKAVVLFLQGLDKTCSSECTLNHSQVSALLTLVLLYTLPAVSWPSHDIFGLAADAASMLVEATVLQTCSDFMRVLTHCMVLRAMARSCS